MYETLTKRLARVIKRAREIAAESECEYLGTEHVLLAIAADQTQRAAQIMLKHGISEAKLKAEIGRCVRQSLDDTWVFGRLPGSPGLKAAITRAIELAGQLNTTQIGAEHLLLAFLDQEDSTAATALSNLGLTAEMVRSEIDEAAQEAAS